MKLGVELAAGIDPFVKWQINNPQVGSKKELLFLNLELSDIAIEVNQGWQKLTIMYGSGAEFVYFFDNEVYIICGLYGLNVLRVYPAFVLEQQIVVRYEMLLLEVLLIDHQDGNLFAVELMTRKQIHIFVGDERISDYIVLDLLALYLHYKMKSALL
jgi:hypothetical protein